MALLKELRDPSNPYHSRPRGGLPPVAIGNPAIDSLNAALSPTESKFWYSLHDSEQVLHLSREAAEQEAYRNRSNVS